MLINALMLLTIKKIRNDFSFKLSTFTTIIQPILWLNIYLYLREEQIVLNIYNNQIRYIDFLVLGIFVWRVISFILSKFPSSIKEDASAIRSIITSPGGEKILIWSGIVATFSIAMIIGTSILLTAILLYDFSIFLNQIIIASLVFLLIIIIHFEIASIIVISRIHIKDMKSIGFITTTIFGLSAGVFFPVELFPSPFDNLAYVLPLTQGLTIMRELLLFPDLLPNINLLVMLLSEALILFISTFILYKKILNLNGLRSYKEDYIVPYFII
jgi:ABC-type polysaccharide/polyol phosphate export permease